MNKNMIIAVVGVIVFVGAGVVFVMSERLSTVSNFDECVAAGNPVLEKYPPVCHDAASGHTFTKRVADYWRYDSIDLMYDSEQDGYACFGCSTGADGNGMCVDPAMAMKPLQETEARYCNNDFVVVESTSAE